MWKENLSELQEIVRELEDRKEELKDANLIEEENLRTKREVEKLSVKNQLYDKNTETDGKAECTFDGIH